MSEAAPEGGQEATCKAQGKKKKKKKGEEKKAMLNTSATSIHVST